MYTKSETQKIKGIAILFMLFHHMFFGDERFVLLAPLAYCMRICVFIFTFLTCYGLSLQFKKIQEMNGSSLKFIIYRYIRAMSPFWFILLLSWLVYAVTPLQAHGYDDGWSLTSVPFMLADFFCVRELLGGVDSFTEWYMNFMVVEITLFPIFYYLAKKLKFSLIPITSVLYFSLPTICNSIYGGNYNMYIFSIELGILMAQNDSFSTVKTGFDKLSRPVKILSGAGLVIFSMLFPFAREFNLRTYHLGIQPLLFTAGAMCAIFFSFLCIKSRPVEKALAFLGRYSAGMFFLHSYLLEELDFFFVKLHYLIIQFAVLVAMSLLMSMAVEGLKKLLHYNSLIDRLCRPFRQPAPVQGAAAVK